MTEEMRAYRREQKTKNLRESDEQLKKAAKAFAANETDETLNELRIAANEYTWDAKAYLEC